MLLPSEIEREARRLRAAEVTRIAAEVRKSIAAKVIAVLEVLGAFRRTPGVRA